MPRGSSQSRIVEIEIDFQIHDHGSVIIIEPVTDAAKEWTDISIDPTAPWWGNGFAVEPRYVDPILRGIYQAGLVWEDF